MRGLTITFQRVVRLFVDDGGLALVSLLWLVAVGELLPRLSVSATWRGAMLFLGLATILVVSVLRRAGR